MVEYWVNGLYQSWGIQARLTALVGEFDLNIKAECTDGGCYLLKVMRPECSVELVEMQCDALKHIHNSTINAAVPMVVPSKHGRHFESLVDEAGNTRLVWVLTFLDGIDYAGFTPKSLKILAHLGSSIAQLHKALTGFNHPAIQRDFKWNLMQASWITERLSVITDSNRRALLSSVMAEYLQHLDSAKRFPLIAIHNDINDYNLLVNATLASEPKISGIVDFGDMCAAPRVCDIAIAGAYMMLDHPQPEAALSALVAAYHAVMPLSVDEIDLIYPLLRSRLAVSVVNSTIEALEKPTDPYVIISQGPAWRLLENDEIAHSLVTPRLRVACGLPVSESATRVEDYLTQHAYGHCANIIGIELSDVPCRSLSVENCSIPRNPFELTAAEARLPDIENRERGDEAQQETAGSDIWLGYYNEPRLIYTDKAFRLGPWKASNRRTVHLGVDLFAPANTNIRAPLDSVVCVIENRTARLDYGGMVVLQHKTPTNDSFYSLYGHLNPDVCQQLRKGQHLKAGDVFAVLGTHEVNGGWAPHLHLQLALTIDELRSDWPGVADPDDLALWNALCPNPAALLNLQAEKLMFTQI